MNIAEKIDNFLNEKLDEANIFSSAADSFPKQKTGRVGVDAEGNEVANSIAISDRAVAVKENNGILIMVYNKIQKKVHEISLTKDELKYISKL